MLKNYMNKMITKIKKTKGIYYLFPLFVFTIFLLYLEFFLNSYIIPKPSDVFISIIDLLSEKYYWNMFFISLKTIYVSLFFAVIISIIIGSLKFFNKKIFTFFDFFLNPLQYISIAIIAIVAILIFGLNQISSYFFMIMVLIPNIYINMNLAMDKLDWEKIIWTQNYTTNKFKIFFWSVLPQLKNQIKIGFIRTHAVAWKIVVVGELIIGVRGLGSMLNQFQKALSFELLFALIVIIILKALIIDKIVRKVIIK